MERSKFGIEGLDTALNGGIPAGNLVVVSGGAGTGKSTLCMQFLINGCQQFHEKGLYLSTEQKLDELKRQAEQYGWPLQDLIDQGSLKVVHINIVKGEDFFKSVEAALVDFKPTRAVVDSLNTLSDYAAVTDYARQLYLERGVHSQAMKEHLIPVETTEKMMSRRMTAALVNTLRGFGATTLLTSELPEKGEYLSSDGISEFLCDGVLSLHYLGVGLSQFRSLQIRKMRYSSHSNDIFGYDFSSTGIIFVKDAV